MAALDIGPGDEVIMADINWIATTAPVVHLGAQPVFVDVLEDTWCLDPGKVEAAITPQTKAIVAVHIYGNLCDMNSLKEISERYGIPLIEDAAEALGSIYHGRRAGSMGVFGTFSFHGTKTITTGEGGMFVTNDDVLYERVLTLSNHGRAQSQTKQFWPDTVGFKYKMSNIQAAIGCGQVERIEDLIAGKRRVFSYYRDQLDGLPIAINPEYNGTVNGYWMPTVVVNSEVSFSREQLLERFGKENIDGRVFFWPLSMLPTFSEQSANVNSYGLYKRAVNLPSYHDLTDSDMGRVVDIIKNALS
jgi:perosamine synthetase